MKATALEQVQQTRRNQGEMRIADLIANPGALLGSSATGACLHYCAPTHGGWGVVRTAMLVPELYMLFVCPSACGRHGAIAAIEHGCKDRVGYLCIEDHEIVLGNYEDEIRNALPALMAQIKPAPKAFSIVVSCIDDLLGTDYDQMLEEFEDTYGIPFRLGRMNPISLDGKLPPGKRVQRDMYDLLQAPLSRDRSIALVGTFQPIAAESEIHAMLKAAGWQALRHIANCRSFEEFQRLGAASLNLATRPEGLAAAQNLLEKYGTPFIFAPTSFSETGILRRYEDLAQATGMAVDCAENQAQLRVLAEATRDEVGDRSIAIDGSATCAPFDLARALIEAGFNVSAIFTEKLPDFERPAFEWLAVHAPDLKVALPVSPTNSWRRPDTPTADIAIGFTAAYLTAAPHVVPISFDEGLYGYHGMSMVYQALRQSLSNTQSESLEDMVNAYGLVI
ncbi:MAG: hypothetical protein KGZ43_10670 [Sulfuritalea sp.]|nr:hypothetical protein [Sulfuritalea sp.]